LIYEFKYFIENQKRQNNNYCFRVDIQYYSTFTQLVKEKIEKLHLKIDWPNKRKLKRKALVSLAQAINNVQLSVRVCFLICDL